MKKSEIEWTDYTWNPVIGCKNKCPYCYAKRINNRFKYIKCFEDPEWRENSFNKKFPKKLSRIFVNSMSDIEYWEPEWMEKVLNKIKTLPDHSFFFLTKNIDIYSKWDFPSNCWIGATVTTEAEMRILYGQGFFKSNPNYKNKIFLSIEPIFEYFDAINIVDWIIVGSESGNRKGKIIPQEKWIETIKELCNFSGVKYFEKDSIAPHVNRVLSREVPDIHGE